MAEFRAPDQNIIEEAQSECQGSVKLPSGPQSTAHESNTKVLEVCKYGEPVRDLKGAGPSGACSLHAETGSCSFPILPSPLNVAAGSCCRCRCQCPCPPVDTCPPVVNCPKPVESCMPGIHKQYRDVYSECKESHLPIGYKTVEHDDLYLPLSSTSDYCNMPMPPTPPPTQRCHCGCAQYQCAQLRPRPTGDVQIPESKPFLQTFVQEEKPESSPKCLPLPDPVDARHCLPSPKRPALPAPLDTCFPSSPKPLALPAPADTCCFPPSPQPKRLALPAPVLDTCCFPPSPKRFALLAKVNPSSKSPSSKPSKRLALPARAEPCCYPLFPTLLAVPSRVSGGMDAEYDIVPEPTEVAVKSCVDNDQKLSCKSQKYVQRIYVCLPYPSNSFPTSPNRLQSPLKPLPSTDENPPVPTLQTPVSPPPPPLPSRCQECVSRRPIPRSPNCCESLYNVETPLPKSPQSRLASPLQPRLASPMQPRLASPVQPYIKSSFQISRIPRVKDFMSSSCQYSPRERPKVFQSQKSGPSLPVSPCHPDPSPNDPSPCPPQKQNPSPCRPPKPSVSQFPKPMGLSPKLPRTKSPLAAELMTVEKHVQCNCSPREVTPLESVYIDQSCSRRPVSPALYEAVSRVLRPESPRSMFQSSSSKIFPRLVAPSPMRLECTCQKLDINKRNNNHFHYAAQIGSRSNSPPQSSNSTGQHRRVENANITQFLNDVKRILKKDLPSRMRPPADQKQDLKKTLKRDFYSNVRSALKSEFPFRDNFPPFSYTRTADQNQELPSSGRTTDRKQQEFFPSETDFTSIVRATLKPEFPSSSSGRTTDRKQDQKLQEFSIPRNYGRTSDYKQEISSSLRATTEQKQQYASCVRTTERGTSPIIGKPFMVDSGTNGAGMDPVFTSRNNEAPSKPRLQTTDHTHVNPKPSTRSLEENIPSQESESQEYGYAPVQAVPKGADSKHPRNFNKRDNTPSWMPRAALKREEMLRCCCGMCKSTDSRSPFTTKCAYCANVHSCCCGMCSCPFQYCPSKSPIPDSESGSTSTTSGGGNNYKLPFCNNSNHPGLARPKSLSPMTRRSYVAGIHEIIPGKHGPRSNSARPKCKPQERHPSPRALLKSFNSYLKAHSRRSKTGLTSTPHRRCSHGHRRSPHWQFYSPPMSPERNCSQRAKRPIVRQPQKKNQLQQAPWGTHPILPSNPRPSNSRFYMGAQIPQTRLISSGPHRGCCCPRCANGKL